MESWPAYDDKLIKEDLINIIIQINGKFRDKIEVPVDMSEEEIRKVAFSREKVYNWLDKKEPIKVIYVPGKLLNIVI